MLKTIQETFVLHTVSPVDGAGQHVGRVPSHDELQRPVVQHVGNESAPTASRAESWVFGFVRAGWPAG